MNVALKSREKIPLNSKNISLPGWGWAFVFVCGSVFFQCIHNNLPNENTLYVPFNIIFQTQKGT